MLGVPQYMQEVSVIGEVQRPTPYFYDSKLDYKDYIEEIPLDMQIKKGIYVVRASGEAVPMLTRSFLE